MKELVIISGKGGTGKTSITASFASLAENMVMCDADVDAADLHLLLDPHIVTTTDFSGGCEAVIEPAGCTACGTCLDLCRFDAVREDFTIDPIACEGCGVCVDMCPEETIAFPEKLCGQWFLSDTRFGPMVHARLGIAEENSGKLVALIRAEAARLAREQKRELILTDGPPGVGCPVIASLGGAAAVPIVTEPTVSGVHDMKRVAELAAHFRIPAMVCINKFDLNLEAVAVIETYAADKGLDLVGKIPFDPVFIEAMVQAKTLPEFAPRSAAGQAVADTWQKVVASAAMAT